jgi:tetraacyldisaccharide 4'-kinase
MLRTKVAEIMTDRDRYPFFSLATLLFGGSVMYKMAMHLRQVLYRQGVLATYQLPCPVVAVGNLTVGGTGKTPMVIFLAELCRAVGYRPVILSRGYKSLSERSGAVVSDENAVLCDPRYAGDEPYLMAALLPGVPIVVGRDRLAVGRKAVARFRPDVILLDDAYQHVRLRRDLNILMMDAKYPFGNGYLLPRGRLREPAGSFRRADAVILTHADQADAQDYSALARQVGPKPVFACRHASIVRKVLRAGCPFDSGFGRAGDRALDFKRSGAFAFAGLGRNDAFFHAMQNCGVRLLGQMSFEDHHAYTRQDLGRISEAAAKSGAGLLVTSDKDFVRLPLDGQFSRDLVIMGVNLDFGRQAGEVQAYFSRRLQGLVER